MTIMQAAIDELRHYNRMFEDDIQNIRQLQ